MSSVAIRPNERRPEREGSSPDLRRQLTAILDALAVASAPGDPTTPTGHADGTDEGVAQSRVSVLDELPALVSVSVAAKILGISRASAYRYAACNDLPAVRLGGRLYVVTARLREFLGAA